MKFRPQKLQKIRLSPSLLESYRLFLTEEWFTQDKMLEAITGEFVPNFAIKLGQGYHSLVQTRGADFLDPDHPEVIGCEGFQFAFDQCIEPVRDFIEAGAYHEIYGGKIFDTQYGPVEIRTKTDAIHGNQGGEWKTTQKSIQIAGYHDSVQWKLCCWALDMVSMDYRVVQLHETKIADMPVWGVKTSDEIQCLWHPNYIEEIRYLLNGLIEFHFIHNLDEYLLPWYMQKKNQKAA